MRHLKLTGLRWEDAHEARKERMDGPQNLGIATGHARSDTSLERFKMCEDGWGLQHSKEEAEDLQSSAYVGNVRLRWLLLQKDTKGKGAQNKTVKH